jgi:hypothetical protein
MPIKDQESNMFSTLSPQVQEQIKQLIVVDFKAAKALYEKHKKDKTNNRK